jgi:hypothetical protein
MAGILRAVDCLTLHLSEVHAQRERAPAARREHVRAHDPAV